MPAVLRASINAEQAGVPAVSFVGSLFESASVSVARFLGMEDPPLAVYPGRIKVDDAETFREKLVTTVADQIVDGLINSHPTLIEGAAEPGPRDIVFRGTLDEVDDHFYDQGWTDGLPIVPPTVDRVEAFLAFTDRDADEVIDVLLPSAREATVWNVAVNGVMSGCKPEYMPVLLAIVEAMADPVFCLKDSGSGAGWEPLVIISGPIIKELDFNSGTGTMRAGRRSNTAIGRFVRMYMRNVAGLRIPPSDTDKGGIGSMFHAVLAEDEDTVASLGWTTYGEDTGVPRTESAVTIWGVMGETAPFGEHGGQSDEPDVYIKPLVDSFGKGMSAHWVWLGLHYASWHPMIILSPHMAKVMHAHGWDKDRLRQYLFDEAKVPARDVLARGTYVGLDIEAGVKSGRLPKEFLESDDPDRLIPSFVRPEWIRFVVAGNPDMYWQKGFLGHGHGTPVTKVIRVTGRI